MGSHASILAVAALLVLLGSLVTGSLVTPVPPFVDATRDTELDFVHFNGMAGDNYFPEIMGSGGALLDYDGDGDLDLYLVQGRMFRRDQSVDEALVPPRHPIPLTDRLYRNDLTLLPDGRRRVRFVDVTRESGLAGGNGTGASRADGFGMGAAVGDCDDDGDPDLYVTNHGPNQLWRNNGDGTFTDVTAASGTGDPRWSVPAVFADLDRDGRLDLFVGNYVDAQVGNHKLCQTAAAVRTYCSPSIFAPLPDRLYRNLGNGTFRDVTTEAGLDRAFGPALGAVVADFDGDGWLDLYVANDGQPNQLWIHQQGMSFRDDALLAGAGVSAEGRPEASMGVDAADFDGDGDMDLFMTHLDRETNTLYVNEGGGLFTDRSVEMGLAQPSRRLTGFGTSWIDYDNDGDLDLLVVNGEVDVIEELSRAGDPFPYAQPDQLFENVDGTTSGAVRYREVRGEAAAPFRVPTVSRGAIFGDLDNDGDLDVVVTQNAGPARVLLNQVGQDRPWLGLRLLTGDPGRDALGARVELIRKRAPVQVRRVRTDGSYASANDPRVLFGLGEPSSLTTSPVEKVRVHWPTGRVEDFDEVEPGRYNVLREGSGREPGSEGTVEKGE
jgi:hypothetical protein